MAWKQTAFQKTTTKLKTESGRWDQCLGITRYQSRIVWFARVILELGKLRIVIPDARPLKAQVAQTPLLVDEMNFFVANYEALYKIFVHFCPGQL